VIFQFDFQKEMSVVSFGPKRHFVPPEDGQSYDCAICLDPMYNEDGSVAPSPIDDEENASGLTTLGCGHENHTACLLRAAKRSAMCPECRAPYRIINPNQSAIANPVAPPAPPVNVNEQLINAARDGNTDAVVQMIAEGADVNAADQTGATALAFASTNSLVAVLVYLIAAGVNVNAANQYGTTALMLASYNENGFSQDDEAVVARLIAAGANVNAVNNVGNTALMIASKNGADYTGVVRRLIAAGANVNAANQNGFTALMLASDNGHETVVARLIAAGANVNDVNGEGISALMYANDNGHEAVATQLRVAVAAGVPALY
jgi:uncharacterized glyoxalase superfamily protein PhnB